MKNYDGGNVSSSISKTSKNNSQNLLKLIKKEKESEYIFPENLLILAKTETGIDANAWNNNIRKIAISLSSKYIPEVGWLVSLVINLFWPVKSESVWDQVKNQVKTMVDDAILSKELEQKKQDLEALGVDLKEYQTLKTLERGTKFSSLRTEITRIYYEMKGSSNNIQFIGLLISLAYIDMTLLQDRFYHGKTMFKDENLKTWKKEFYGKCYEYSMTITSLFQKWKVWRRKQIEVSTNNTLGFFEMKNYVDVIDKTNNKKFTKQWNTPVPNYSSDESKHATQYLSRYFGDLKKLVWENEEIAKFHYQVLSTIYNLPKFLPEYKNEKGFVLCGDTDAAIVHYGPYYNLPQDYSWKDSERIHFDFPKGRDSLKTFAKDKLKMITLWTKDIQVTGMKTDWEISGKGMLFGVAAGSKENSVNLDDSYIYRVESWIDYKWNSSVGGPKICSLRSQKIYVKNNDKISNYYFGVSPDEKMSKCFDSKDIFTSDDYQMYAVSPGIDGSYRGGFDQVFCYFTPICTNSFKKEDFSL